MIGEYDGALPLEGVEHQCGWVSFGPYSVADQEAMDHFKTVVRHSPYKKRNGNKKWEVAFPEYFRMSPW